MKSILFISLIFIVSCQAPVINDAPAIKSAEGIKLRDTNGVVLDLAKLRGKKVFLNFWATWCRPCIAEMPSIMRAKAALSPDSIHFLFASAESAGEIATFSRDNKFPFHFVAVENSEELGITAIPATWIFDREGKLESSHTGARDWDEPVNLAIIKK